MWVGYRRAHACAPQDLGKGCLEPALDRDVRRAAVGCVEHTMRLMGVQASSFGQAVVAIDIFCRQTAQAEKLHLLVRLPSACAAICSIICKMNGLQAARARGLRGVIGAAPLAEPQELPSCA